MKRLHSIRVNYVAILTLAIIMALTPLFTLQQADALTFHATRVIDDPVFDNYRSMSASSIDAFLNRFSGSCISSASGFLARDPNGYNPTNGFLYGGNVTAGRIIYDAANAYQINPQVLLATIEKEEGLVRGDGTYGCSTLAISAAVGYGCPDSSKLYNYSSVNLYTRHGTTYTSINSICVKSSQMVGFSQQIIHAAWLLKFGEQRSQGNLNWAVIKGSWNNSDDPQTCYGGPMTQGWHAVCPSGATTYYDGYKTIDGTAVHMDTGATAALYWYTPHFHGNQLFFSIYTGWFGAPLVGQAMPDCQTDASKVSCVWLLDYPRSANEFLTSSTPERDNLAYFSKFKYRGIAFFASVTSGTDTVPVYRLYDPRTGGHFWTAGINEKNTLTARGYGVEGVAFYAVQPGSARAGSPVYRIYDSRTGAHIWTASESYKNALLANPVYKYEGISFYSAAPQVVETAPSAGFKNVYRFNGLPGNEHFWTSSVAERNNLLQVGYPYEGVGWQVTQSITTTPVYRLYSSKQKRHFWTASSTEKNNLLKLGYGYEGIVFYASNTTTGAPVYRIYDSKSGLHFWTASVNERNSSVQNSGYRLEGVAWYD